MYRIGNDLGFIAHPRTASRATRDVLEACGAKRCAGHHQISETDAREVLQAGGVMACTTRNMFDVIVSWYYNQHFNHKGEKLNPSLIVPDFETYLLGELIPKPKHRWFLTPVYHYGLSWCKRILRYDTLQQDLDILLTDMGLQPKIMPWVGKSIGKRDYRSYYNKVSRRAVEDRWGMDLHLTGQEF